MDADLICREVFKFFVGMECNFALLGESICRILMIRK